MAECSYSFAFDGDPSAFYRQAKDGVKKQGGSFLGDNSQGVVTVPSALGEVAFNYRRVPGKILIDVTEKPLLVPCAQIADAIGALIPKPAVKKKVVIDSPTETNTPHGKVIEMPVTVIEGQVPASPWKHRLMWLGAVLGLSGLLWLTLRRSTRSHYDD